MPRKSSIHFKPVTNVRFAVSHSERTDLSEPGYLLPKEHQLDNIVVAGSLSEQELSAMFIKQQEGMTGQAKARKSSPFWEGVVVLSNTNGQEQSNNLKKWAKAYEKETGHKVLHMSIHLDEGYIDAVGSPQYNPHAHVIVSRMDARNRVINLDRKQLAKVQDLTAEMLQMERGSTLAERQGKRGRKHVPHREFREQADAKRLELENEKGNADHIQKLFAADTKIISNLKEQVEKQAAEIARLNEQYRLDREEFKRLNAEAAAAGLAKVKSQKDYQVLKKEHEAALAEAGKVPALVAQVAALKPQTDKVPELVAELRNAKIDAIKKEAEIYELKQVLREKDDELEDVKAKFSAMASAAYQDQKKEGWNPALFAPPGKAQTLVVLAIDTSTAAFEDIGRNDEAARIVRDAAAIIEEGWDGKPFDLQDTNGNKVGQFEAVEVAAIGALPELPVGGIRLVMAKNENLVSVMKLVATKIQMMVKNGTERIRDAVGNVIGQLTVRSPVPPAERDQHESPKGP